jgi:hypothetical protein
MRAGMRPPLAADRQEGNPSGHVAAPVTTIAAVHDEAGGGAATPRALSAHCRNGLLLRSSPKLLIGPCPQMKTIVSPRGKSFVLMASISAA